MLKLQGKIPQELQILKQWIVVPDLISKVPYNYYTGEKASPINPADWCYFHEAIDLLQKGYVSGIGFVLTKNDPYVCIDLDTYKNPESCTNLHMEIFKQADSYTERSTNCGAHIIVKGELTKGYRSDENFLEIYPFERYILLTGNCVNHFEIKNAQRLLNELVSRMQTISTRGRELTSEPSFLTDQEVIVSLLSQANADKFKYLYYGEVLKNPGHYNTKLKNDKATLDQSQADAMLLGMLDFKTRDVAQVFRLFKASALYRKEKGSHPDADDYIKRSLKFARAANDNDRAAGQAIDLSHIVLPTLEPMATQSPPPSPRQEHETDNPSIDQLPEGVIKYLAQKIYDSAARQVELYAIVTAVSAFAGLVSRYYYVNAQSGALPKLYQIVLGSTGSGKSVIDGSVQSIYSQIEKGLRMSGVLGWTEIKNHLGAYDYTSDTSLEKDIIEHPSRLRRFTEFSTKFEMMTRSGKGFNAKETLLNLLLTLWDRTYTSTMPYKQFAGKDQRATEKEIIAPTINIIAESQPQLFYELFSSKSFSSGLISRFLIFDNTKEINTLNKNARELVLDSNFILYFKDMFQRFYSMPGTYNPIPVEVDNEVIELTYKIDAENVKRWNTVASKFDVEVENRSIENALRVAALFAIAQDYANPRINLALFNFGWTYVQYSIANMKRRISEGLVVPSEGEALDFRFQSICEEWTKMSKDKKKKYCSTDDLLQHPIIPFQFICKRLRSRPLSKLRYTEQKNAIEAFLNEQVSNNKLIVVPSGEFAYTIDGQHKVLTNRYGGRYYFYDQNK